MNTVLSILFGGLAGGFGLSLLFAAFGAAARFSAFRQGHTPETSTRQALIRGTRDGLGFGLFFGLLAGGLFGYWAGSEKTEIGAIATWFLGGGVLIVGALIIGLTACYVEQDGKKKLAKGESPGLGPTFFG
jgi:hypothetical protein